MQASLVHGTLGGRVVAMPLVGFGTYKLKKDVVREPLRRALLCGYTMLDTAFVYMNEAEIGEVTQHLPMMHH